MTPREAFLAGRSVGWGGAASSARPRPPPSPHRPPRGRTPLRSRSGSSPRGGLPGRAPPFNGRCEAPPAALTSSDGRGRLAFPSPEWRRDGGGLSQLRAPLRLMSSRARGAISGGRWREAALPPQRPATCDQITGGAGGGGSWVCRALVSPRGRDGALKAGWGVPRWCPPPLACGGGGEENNVSRCLRR